MKQYAAPELKMISFSMEEVLFGSGFIELPPVPLRIKSSTSPFKDDGTYDIF